MFVEDRPQLDIDVFRPPWRVVNVQDTIRPAHFLGLFHRTILTCLVARDVVMM